MTKTQVTVSKSYPDNTRCPHCDRTFVIYRRKTSSGRMVATFCPSCAKTSVMIAGPVK